MNENEKTASTVKEAANTEHLTKPDDTTKAAACQVSITNYDALPEGLEHFNQFLLWNVDAETPKRPYTYDDSIKGVKLCNVTDLNNLLPLSDAITIANGNGYGVGFALGGGVVGIDLDHCIADGELNEFAAEIVSRFKETYCEYSQSKTGIHILYFDNDVEGLSGKKSAEIEIYPQDRYFALTGNRLPDTGENVKSYKGATRQLIRDFFGTSAENSDFKAVYDSHGGKSKDSDGKVLEMIRASKQAEKFNRLFVDGNVDQYKGDASSADQALMCILAYWTHCNAPQMERLFNQSALAKRDKWNRTDYRQRTIAKAINYNNIEKDNPTCYNKDDKPLSNNTNGAVPSSIILSNSSESVNKGAENMSDEIYSPSTFDPLLIPDEVLNDLLRLHNSDAGNAERLIKCYGLKRMIYIEDLSRWAKFDGVKWKIAADSSNSSIISLILSMAKQLQSFTRKRLAEVEPKIKDQLTDRNQDEQKQFDILQSAAKTAKALENKKKYSPALDTAKGFPSILIPSKKLNYDPMLLNCQNGMLDLTTGKLHKHDPTKLFSLCAGVEYIPGYRSKVVEYFLASILPDPDAHKSLLTYLGYCLTGDVRHDKALFIHGGGRNGKGSLLGALLKLFGDFGTTVRNSLFLQSRSKDTGENATPELMKLENRRLAIVDELTDKYLDETLFKQLTGGDPVSARPLHQDSKTIDPTWKIILSGNSLPRIKDANDISISERLLVIKFEQTFTGKDQDPTIRDKLKSQEALTGLLNILVESCLEWQKLGCLYEPESVNDFKREYLDENDLIGEFIEEHCELGTDYQVTCKDFCKAFKDSSAEAAFMSDKAIIKMAEKIGGIAKHRVTKGNVFKGIKLIEA